MKKTIITISTLALMVSTAWALDGEPKKANKFQSTLVNAYEECTAPSEQTGGALALDACPAVDSSANQCAFGDKSKGKVQAKTKDDVTVQVLLTKLENCEGEILCGFATARSTTNDCTVSGRCTAEDLVDFPVTAGLSGSSCCVVDDKGKCKIKTTINSNNPAGTITTGENTAIAVFNVKVAIPTNALGVVAGTTVAYAGVLVN